MYFSESTKVEKYFEEEFEKHFKVDFQGEITHFLGVQFTAIRHEDNHLTICMTQQTDTEALISKAGLATANGTSTSLQKRPPHRRCPRHRPTPS